MLLFLYKVIFIHIDVGWSEAYSSQFVTIVYKIKTYFKNDKHLITFELLLFGVRRRRRRPSSVVRRKLFQKSSPLKVQDQWKPNLVWIITRVSNFKFVSSDAVHQPTWPLLLKIEHMVKLQVLGNNSETVNNIKNLTWNKNYQHCKIYLPCNFEVNLITHLGVIALFSSNL
jgi:hypothetical protein